MERKDFVFFWGECRGNVINKGCFSQWQPAIFVVDGVKYACAEQFMMAEKARLFGDQENLENILKSTSPRAIKAFGRKVRGFDAEKWGKVKFDIVVKGNMAKFSQNPEMRTFLLGTGLRESDPAILDPANWKGENLLGKALMVVREKLSAAGGQIGDKIP